MLQQPRTKDDENVDESASGRHQRKWLILAGVTYSLASIQSNGGGGIAYEVPVGSTTTTSASSSSSTAEERVSWIHQATLIQNPSSPVVALIVSTSLLQDMSMSDWSEFSTEELAMAFGGGERRCF